MTTAKHIQQNLNGETVMTLQFPVKLATGATLTQVTVRRPKVGDLRAVSQFGNEVEQEIALFSRLTNLVPEDLEELDFADYQTLQTFFRNTQNNKQ